MARLSWRVARTRINHAAWDSVRRVAARRTLETLTGDVQGGIEMNAARLGGTDIGRRHNHKVGRIQHHGRTWTRTIHVERIRVQRSTGKQWNVAAILNEAATGAVIIQGSARQSSIRATMMQGPRRTAVHEAYRRGNLNISGDRGRIWMRAPQVWGPAVTSPQWDGWINGGGSIGVRRFSRRSRIV